jgi:transposase
MQESRAEAANQTVSKAQKSGERSGIIKTAERQGGGDMDFIRGGSREQTILFPGSIGGYADENNAARAIDAYINSLDMYEMSIAAPAPRETGRPAYDPRDMLKLYIYGHMNRIRPPRRLEKEAERNPELIRLLGKLPPDHKTAARFRHGNTAALKKLFQHFARLCARLGPGGKGLIAIGGGKFKAVNPRGRNYAKQQIENKITKTAPKIGEYMKGLGGNGEAGG